MRTYDYMLRDYWSTMNKISKRPLMTINIMNELSFSITQKINSAFNGTENDLKRLREMSLSQFIITK